jgi:hypothetical protein
MLVLDERISINNWPQSRQSITANTTESSLTAPIIVIATNFTRELNIQAMQLVEPVRNWFSIPTVGDWNTMRTVIATTNQAQTQAQAQVQAQAQAQAHIGNYPSGTFLGLNNFSSSSDSDSSSSISPSWASSVCNSAFSCSSVQVSFCSIN